MTTLTPKPNHSIIFPWMKVLCPTHGCFMYQGKVVNGVAFYYCPVSCCGDSVHRAHPLSANGMGGHPTDLPVRDLPADD